MNIDNDSWIVASTHPHKERLALEHVVRQGFRAYCPLIRRQVRHARRLQKVLRPLFSGYLFIQLDPHMEQWRSIASTVGIRDVVRFGDRPGTISSQFIDGLIATEQDGAVALPRARDSYQPGEKVRVRQGAFDGTIATVLSASDRDRVMVLMDLLRQRVRVRIGIDEIVPA